jgi:hypothetical protein
MARSPTETSMLGLCVRSPNDEQKKNVQKISIDTVVPMDYNRSISVMHE